MKNGESVEGVGLSDEHGKLELGRNTARPRLDDKV